jgi:P2 family phage major capsid protein
VKNPTRVAFNAYVQHIARLNKVPSAVETFSVDPTIQQTLEKKIQESSDFLNSINIVPVTEMSGAKLGLGVSGPIASRTDTTNADRVPRQMQNIDSKGYACKQTNYDTAFKYNLLDTWAKFDNFQVLLRDAIVQQQALDRMMIGFNGTSAAATTNLAANPMLQDVNIGWLQNVRNDAHQRVMDHGAVPGKVTVGPTGDYRNLDALVFDAYMTLLDPWHRNKPDLVAIVGRNLMHDKLFPLVNEVDDPTEIMAADVVRSQKRLGGLPGVQVPFFPDNTVAVTTLKNLSIYWQESARRRNIIDNPKRDQIENYESSNDAFVVEDYGLFALVEKIEIQA